MCMITIRVIVNVLERTYMILTVLENKLYNFYKKIRSFLFLKGKTFFIKLLNLKLSN